MGATVNHTKSKFKNKLKLNSYTKSIEGGTQWTLSEEEYILQNALGASVNPLHIYICNFQCFLRPWDNTMKILNHQ